MSSEDQYCNYDGDGSVDYLHNEYSTNHGTPSDIRRKAEEIFSSHEVEKEKKAKEKNEDIKKSS
jgi:hypothetical protein